MIESFRVLIGSLAWWHIAFKSKKKLSEFMSTMMKTTNMDIIYNLKYTKNNFELFSS